jgi:hypothetical protein
LCAIQDVQLLGFTGATLFVDIYALAIISQPEPQPQTFYQPLYFKPISTILAFVARLCGSQSKYFRL